ncbi:MAG: YigZ family protein [Desulforhopalus sp.]|nr:YigZ family protein [Desulforhopalus sp.]
MQLKTSKLVKKKSKFFGYLYSLKSDEEYQKIVKEISKEHKKASHVCTAMVLGREEKFKNDGEVGYPGRTLLGLLKHAGLEAHLIIVVRYFGGIKLGPGGVSRAFKECGKMLF